MQLANLKAGVRALMASSSGPGGVVVVAEAAAAAAAAAAALPQGRLSPNNFQDGDVLQEDHVHFSVRYLLECLAQSVRHGLRGSETELCAALLAAAAPSPPPLPEDASRQVQGQGASLLNLILVLLGRRQLTATIGVLAGQRADLERLYDPEALMRTPRDVETLRMWATAVETSSSASKVVVEEAAANKTGSTSAADAGAAGAGAGADINGGSDHVLRNNTSSILVSNGGPSSHASTGTSGEGGGGGSGEFGDFGSNAKVLDSNTVLGMPASPVSPMPSVPEGGAVSPRTLLMSAGALRKGLRSLPKHATFDPAPASLPLLIDEVDTGASIDFSTLYDTGVYDGGGGEMGVSPSLDSTASSGNQTSSVASLPLGSLTTTTLTAVPAAATAARPVTPTKRRSASMTVGITSPARDRVLSRVSTMADIELPEMDFTTSAELQRENHHFFVSESLIDALEEARNVHLQPSVTMEYALGSALFAIGAEGVVGGNGGGDAVILPSSSMQSTASANGAATTNLTAAATTMLPPASYISTPPAVRRLMGHRRTLSTDSMRSREFYGSVGMGGGGGNSSGGGSPPKSIGMLMSPGRSHTSSLSSSWGENNVFSHNALAPGRAHSNSGGGASSSAALSSAPHDGGSISTEEDSMNESVGSALGDWVAVGAGTGGEGGLHNQLTPSQRHPQQNHRHQPHHQQSSSPESVARGLLQSLADEYACATAGMSGGGGGGGALASLREGLQPMVTEAEGVPQGLLPMPVVSFDDLRQRDEDQAWCEVPPGNRRAVPRTRGNDEWAPPRRQIIFTIHPRTLSKRAAIAKQNHRCAGCGLRVELSFVKRFRYCEYMGKFFCTSCHNRTTAVVPARVLTQWDFKRYPVSQFAADLLVDIYNDPLYDIGTLAPALLKKVKPLFRARTARQRLAAARNYLKTCRSGADLLRAVDSPPHLCSDPTLYSLEELVNIRAGTYLPAIEALLAQCIEHILGCPLCMAKGFICEVCDDPSDIIFPFQVDKVMQCPECSVVYHKHCYANVKTCLRCERKHAYEQRRRDTMAKEKRAEMERMADAAVLRGEAPEA